MYGRLAPRYDNELRDEFSRQCARTTAEHLEQHGTRPPAAILDLACGTGLTAHQLQSLGFAVTGVDSSQEMLSLARQRDGAANGASFLHGDIRDLRVQGPFQAVCCFGDVLNHMLAADEVLATLASAYRVLAPRGWLVCDTNSLDTFRSSMWNNQLPLSFWQGKRIRTRCVFDEEEGLGHMECQVYEIGQDLEMHHLIERYHDHLTMHGWLSQVGFTQIERCDFHPLDLSDSYPEIGVLKSLWTARKPG